MTEQALHHERWELLRNLNAATDTPLTALAFVWLWLLILDFTTGLGSLLQAVTYVIWVLFVLDFAIELIIAPDKQRYLRSNWLTALSLALPAFRVLRVFRALRALRAIRAARTVGLLRLVTSLNRGMRAAAATFGRRGVGYVIALTVLVVFAGAAGMLYIHSPDSLRAAGYDEAVQEGAGLESYGESLWWTAMIVTTLGSEYWPQTVEGRILCWLLALYAFGVFGYLTATIASYFIDVNKPASPTPAPDPALQAELATLRRQIAALSAQLENDSANPKP